MAAERSLNTYKTIEPSWMIANADYLSQILFNILPGKSRDVFTVNQLTGHFTFEVEKTDATSTGTPTREEDAVNAFNSFIDILNDRVINRNVPNVSEKLALLFDRRILKLRGVSAKHAGNGQVKSWVAAYGFELPIGARESTANKSTQSGPLDNASVILELTGSILSQMSYNALPIISTSRSPALQEAEVGIVYRKINIDTIAPFAVGPVGFTPASKSSIEIQVDSPMVFSPQRILNSSVASCPSMITLSGVKKPLSGVPGQATIDILMEYRFITIGEGAVSNAGVVSTVDFEKLYQKGDMPGVLNPTGLLLEGLPQVKTPPIVISSSNLAKSKKINPSTGQPFFSNYYNCTVKYKYTLSNAANFSLWDAIKWSMQCPETRGFFCLIPFEKEVRDLKESRQNAGKLTNAYIKSYLLSQGISASDIAQFVQADYDIIKSRLLLEPTYAYQGKIASFVILNLLMDNKGAYSNANIQVDGLISSMFNSPTTRSYSYFNADMHNALNAINSDIPVFVNGAPTTSNGKPVVMLTGADIYYDYIVTNLVNFAFSKIDLFDANALNSAGSPYLASSGKPIPNVGASGKLGRPNIVLLNPRLYGKAAVGQPYPYHTNPATNTFLNQTELLAHEAGHNAADLFEHGTGKYEYSQAGLQSNQTGQVYPTIDNTIGLLSDTQNLSLMTVLP